MNVTIHIDRLVLDGLHVEQRQGPAWQLAIEQELAHLLADGGSPARKRTGGAVPRLNAGAMHMSQRADATVLGKQIIAAVRGGLGGRR